MSDIDQLRSEIKQGIENEQEAKSYRAALYRYWRFLWRQGIDLRSFDPWADQLLEHTHDDPALVSTLPEAFRHLDSIHRHPTFLPEVRGKKEKVTTHTDWPLYHGTRGTNNGHSPDVGPSVGKIVWQYPKTNGWNYPPTVVDGTVFAPGAGADIVGYRIDERTGRLRWKARSLAESYYQTSSTRGTPALGASTVSFRVGERWLTYDRENGQSVAPPAPEARLLPVRQGTQRIQVIALRTGQESYSFSSEDYIIGEPASTEQELLITLSSGEVILKQLPSGENFWSRQLNGELRGSGTLGTDHVYLGSADRTLYALDRANGTPRWKFTADAPEDKAFQYFSSPLVTDAAVYVGTAARRLHCLDRTTGAVRWTYRTTDWVRAQPAVADDTVYVATLDGRVTALVADADTARLVWQRKISHHAFTADLVMGTYGLLATDQNMILYSLDRKTGQVRWQQSLLDGAWVDSTFVAAEEQPGQQSSPTVVDGVLYIAGPDGFLNAVDTETGRERWRFEIGSNASGSPTVAEGKVFVGQTYRGYGTYFALAKDTGEPIWSTTALGSVWVSPAYDHGKLFLGNRRGDFFAVDPNDGTIRWNYFTATDTPQADRPLDDRGGHGWPPGVYCNPAVQDGVVYSGSWAGYYFALDQETGELLWRTKTQPEGIQGGLPDSSAPVLHKDRLYVQKAGHYIAALRREDGREVWQWAAPDGFLQNGTVAAQGNQIYGSAVRKVTELPYHATVYAFSDGEAGGELRWQYRGGGGLTAPVITNTKLIFGSSADPFVTCLDRSTGDVVWKTYVGGMMLESVPTIYGDKVFALIKNGYLYAIE